MKAYECRGLYPPRFQVFLASSHKNPTLQGGKIEFLGAESDLQYDIHLDPTAIPITTFISEIRLLKKLCNSIFTLQGNQLSQYKAIH